MIAFGAHLTVFLVLNVLINSYGPVLNLGLQTHALLGFKCKWTLHSVLPIALLSVLNGTGNGISQDPGDRSLWFDLLP